jgi:hypothetical protein
MMFLDEATDRTPLSFQPMYAPLMVVLAVPTVVFGLFWQPLLRISQASLSFFAGP